MRMSAIKSVLQLIVVAVVVSISSGCVNLEAVRDFSKQSSALTGSAEVIDYRMNWPDRRKEYDEVSAYLGIPGPGATASSLTPDEVKSVKALQTSLSSYMLALASLADDQNIDLSKQVGGLVDSLDNLPGVTDDRKKTNAAYGAIIGLLKLPLDAYRQYEIRRLILKYNDDVKQLSDVLAALTRSYKPIVNNEWSSVKAWAAGAFRSRRGSVSFQDAVGMRAYMAEIDNRYKGKDDAIETYAKAVEKIGTTHAELAANLKTLNKDGFKVMEENLKSAKADIEAAKKKFDEAFAD